MIVVMDPGAPETAIESVISHLVAAGFDVHRSSGQDRVILGVVGDVTLNDMEVIRELKGVSQVVRVSEPFRLASRRFKARDTVVEGPWGLIGGEKPWIAIEPIGLERDGAAIPHEILAARAFDATITRSPRVEGTLGGLACLSLHASPSEAKWPVIFVERQPSWGANAWLGAAERELERGEGSVVLLEAGGEYPTGARTLEIAAIARVKQRSHLPIVVDVPTIAQRTRYTTSVAHAAIASGADGVVLRVWIGKDGSVPRVPAALRWDEAVALADQLRRIGAVVRA
jgi:3-deoxy-7-phosphoheptulonate synthase